MSRKGRIALGALGLVVGLKVVGEIAAATVLGYSMEPVAVRVPDAEAPAVTSAAAPDPALATLAATVKKLEGSVTSTGPRGRYIVIDRGNNRLWLKNGAKTELEAVVSTGSRTVLKESGGKQRTWTFDTPPGRFEVLSERKFPVWVKPDWAFLEEGQAPPTRSSERVEKGSLGEWALDLGDGYMIHGTLYERLLGRSLTHGCIRVGRDDLRQLAAAVRPGTPVYIF